MLEKSLEFGELRADDVMTPRVKVKTLAPDQPVIAVIRRPGPVAFAFPGDQRRIRDRRGNRPCQARGRGPHEDRDDVPIRDVMADPVLVPSTIELIPLLAELRKVGLQVAIVVDEFGSFDGIVTLEDLIGRSSARFVTSMTGRGSGAKSRRESGRFPG